jgi:hypothetical protein
MSKGTRREVTSDERDAIVADYKNGVPTDQLAAKHGRHMSTILAIVKRSGTAMRGKGWRPDGGAKKPSKHRRANASGIPDEERERMAADYAAGMSQADMMKKYGRSPDAIRNAAQLHGVPLRGRGWRKDKLVMKARKKGARWKMKKKTRRAATVAASISHANKALKKAHKQNGGITRAVSALLKSLEHEEIQDLFVDFGRRTYKVTRLRVEEGSA